MWYVVVRDTDLLFFRFVRIAGSGNVRAVPPLDGSIPDGLWLLSGILLIRVLWFGSVVWSVAYAWLLCAAGLAMETLQFYGVIPGTFDILDIVFFAGITSAWSVYLKTLAGETPEIT